MFHTFYGGVHPPARKQATQRKQIRTLPAPEQIVLPLLMHAGRPCRPLVSPGVKVLLGQAVGEAATADDVPVHSPVSGMVLAVEPRPHPNGNDELSVIIQNDFRDAPSPHVAPRENVPALTRAHLLDIIRDAGIVGMGGAGLPTHVKLREGMDKVDKLLINGAECEPYLTADHRLMLEHPEEIVGGVALMMKILQTDRAAICIEANKFSVVDRMSRAIKAVNPAGIRLRVLRNCYPLGAERQLIQAVTRRQVPPGKTPIDVGCTVFNVDTAAAVARAVYQGYPLIRRIVTVSGPGVRRPKNLRVRIGTPMQMLFDSAGASRKQPELFLMGGPMTGTILRDLAAPVIKTTNAFLALDKKILRVPGHSACLYCGRCVSVCPMHLMPVLLARAAAQGRHDQLKRLHLEDCIACGSCTYVCPGRQPLVRAFRGALSTEGVEQVAGT